MKECYRCGKDHESDITFANGWPVCSEECKAILVARLDEWLS